MRTLIVCLSLIALASGGAAAAEKAKSFSGKGCVTQRSNGCVYLQSGQWTYELKGENLPQAGAGHQVRIKGTRGEVSSNCSTRTTVGAVNVKKTDVLQGLCKKG